jgi:hypothetical protein
MHHFRDVQDQRHPVTTQLHLLVSPPKSKQMSTGNDKHLDTVQHHVSKTSHSAQGKHEATAGDAASKMSQAG